MPEGPNLKAIGFKGKIAAIDRNFAEGQKIRI
jgi:hypothetical protein